MIRSPLAGSSRAVSPVLGTVLLIALCVCLAAVVAGSVATLEPTDPPTDRAFELSADADRGELALTLLAGEPIDADELSVTVEVDGQPLDEQPPVPFVGATGFFETPIGPFNAEADSRWRAGERAGFRLAATNGPEMEAGDRVSVRVVLEGRTIATVEAIAG